MNHETEKQLRGKISRIIYRNEQNGYTIAILTLSPREQCKIIGTFAKLTVDDEIAVWGQWEQHSKHGLQFLVSRAKYIKPQTVEEIEKYLASGLIKGIGPANAAKIVGRFGDKTLEVIKKTPHKLTEVQGIGKKMAEKIAQQVIAKEAAEDALVFLKNHNIGNRTAIKIYKKYEDKTIEAIRENPYRLIDDVHGIGFQTADTIAKSVGIKEDSEFRIRAGLKYCLQKAEEEGHVYLPREQLIEGTSKGKGAVELLGVARDVIEYEINAMIRSGELIDENGNIYLPSYFKAEKSIASHLMRIMKAAPKATSKSIDDVIRRYELKYGIQLAIKQKEAVKKALTSGVMILTGGPGTGKTTTIRAIIDTTKSFKKNAKIVLAAPTGRAAKRMSEACKIEASTVHRLLEFHLNEDTGRMMFQKNEKDQLDADLIIIDEASMLDIHMANALFQAIRSGSRLIIVGDSDQLPSVGAGNVLNDLIESEVIPTVCLNEIFRQAQQSKIVLNAHRINRGKFPDLSEDNNYANDFWFIEAETPEEIIRHLQALYYFDLPEYDPLKDIQVLTPMRKTAIGIDALNQLLQSILNPGSPSKAELVHGLRRFRVGDKVMIIKNNYEKNVFNGDIGIITSISKEADSITVNLYDNNREVTFENDEIDNLTLSYACSIHKSQGSEWPCCIVIMSTSHAIMLQRNLLYTAITRARKQVIVIGTSKAVAMAVRNNHVAKRYSTLRQRLRDAYHGKTETTKQLHLLEPALAF